MHTGTRDEPTSPPSLENFTFQQLCVYLALFHLFVFISISNITQCADFVMCRVVLAVYLDYLSYSTLSSVCNYYKIRCL